MYTCVYIHNINVFICIYVHIYININICIYTYIYKQDIQTIEKQELQTIERVLNSAHTLVQYIGSHTIAGFFSYGNDKITYARNFVRISTICFKKI